MVTELDTSRHWERIKEQDNKILNSWSLPGGLGDQEAAKKISKKTPDNVKGLLSLFSHLQLFATLWTVAHQAPLSMGFSRQESWNRLPCCPPGDLPDPGIELKSLMSPAGRRVLHHQLHLGSLT